HHVRGHQPADQGHRRAAHSRFCALANPRVVLTRSAVTGGDRRGYMLVGGVGGAWVGSPPPKSTTAGGGRGERGAVPRGRGRNGGVGGNMVLAGLLFSLVMGFIGGLVPALSAMRLRPLESVR